jgi:hypothetical protein
VEAGLPDWEAVRARMLAPKPPLRATAYAIGKPTVEAALPDAGPTWALSALDPARFATLPGATGAITGRETASGRNCVVAEVVGLRGKGAVRLWIDEEMGAILRMERADDPAPLVVLDDVRIGEPPA